MKGLPGRLKSQRENFSVSTPAIQGGGAAKVDTWGVNSEKIEFGFLYSRRAQAISESQKKNNRASHDRVKKNGPHSEGENELLNIMEKAVERHQILTQK